MNLRFKIRGQPVPRNKYVSNNLHNKEPEQVNCKMLYLTLQSLNSKWSQKVLFKNFFRTFFLDHEKYIMEI